MQMTRLRHTEVGVLTQGHEIKLEVEQQKNWSPFYPAS